MNKTKNFVRKQLLLVGSLLICIVAYGDIPSVLPGRLTAKVGYQNTYVYSSDIPILIEPFSADNHRVIALELHWILYNNVHITPFALKFRANGVTRVVDSPWGNALQTLDMFMCYDANIPDVLVYSFDHTKTDGVSDYLATYDNLQLGYNYRPIRREDFYPDQRVVVLPMLSSVSNSFYKSYYQTETVSAVTEGDEVWFGCTAEGTGVEAFACTKGSSEMVPLGATKFEGGGSSCSFKAKLLSSFSNQEEQDIYIFSYVESYGNRYYSSNYKKMQLTVKPAILFVNALDVGGKLYITDDNSDPIKVKNISTNCDLKINGSKYTPGKTVSINRIINKQDKTETITIKIQIVQNDKLLVEHDEKTYKIEKLLRWGEETTNCSFKLTAPPYLNSGFGVYPIVSYDDGQGHGNGGMSKFPYTNSNRYKYTYSVRYTYGGKYIESETYIRNFLPLKMSTTAKNIVGCENGNDNSVGKITITSVSGGSGTYTYSSTGNGVKDGNVYKYKTAGSKTITVTDSYGCTVSSTASIGVSSPFSASFISANIIGCENGNDNSVGKITITSVSGGSGTYTYSSTGNGVKDGNVYKYKTAGSKTITVTDSYGCTVSSTASIGVSSPFSASFTSANIIGCENGNDNSVGKITVTASGGSGSYTYSSTGNGVQDGNVYKYKTVGSKTVTVTDSNYGCTASKTATIGVSTPFSALFSPENIKGCANGNDNSIGKITVVASGGSESYTYTSTGDGVQDGNVYKYKTAGYKTVTVTDNQYGCTASRTPYISIHNPFSASFSPENIKGCANGNDNSIGKITVVASGGSESYTYTSTGDGVQDGNVYKYKTAGYKTVTVTDNQYGCTASRTPYIGILTPFSASFSLENIKGCENNDNTAGKITVVASGGSESYTYTSTGDGVQDGNVYKYKTAGYKTVTVTDSEYGCEASETKEIKLDNKFDFTIVPTKTNGYDIACNGGNGTLTFNINGGTKDSNDKYTYNGNPISNGASLSRSGVGPHSFTISDSKGCSETHSITLSQPAKLEITKLESVKADCNGIDNGSIIILASGGVLPYTYVKTEGVDSESSDKNSFTGLKPGDYLVKVTDGNDCATPETTVNVGNANLLTLPTPTTTPVLCYGKNTGSITLTPSFNKTGFNGKFYYWLNGEKMASNKFEGLADAKDYKVKVQPEGSECFVEMDNVEVKGPDTDELKYTVTPVNFTTTTSSDARIDVTPSGGWGGHTVIVKDNNGAVVSDNTDLRPGKYTVTVTDAEGCIANDNKEYTIARPETDLKLNVVEHINVKCHGESTGKIKVIASGGWGNYSYTLSPNKGKTRDSADYRIFENLPSLSGNTYKVTVADKMDVVKTATIIIEQPDAALSASSKIDSVKCNGGNDGKITVTVTGGTHGTRGYTLSLDGNTYYDESGKIEITGKKEGVYKYTVVDANECVSPEYTVKIDEPTAIVLSADAAGELKNGFNIPCADETGEIVVSASGGTAGYQFSIDGGPFTAQYGKDAKHTFSGVEGGKHKITVKDGHGCIPKSEEVELTKPEPIIITKIDLTQPLCNGDSDGEMTIYAKGGVPDQNDAYNFSLDGNSASEKAQHTFTGLAAKDNYHVVVTDANECFVEKDIDLGQPAKLEASVSNVKNNKCNGDKEGSITFAISGGTGSYYYALNGANNIEFGNDMTISGLPSLPNKNPHSIVVSDAHGCKADAISQEIEQPDPITAQTVLNDYNGYNIRCFGDADDARIKISGGVENYTTTLGDRTLTGKDVQFVGLKKGNYSYKVVDGNDCSETFDFEMKQPDNLMLTYIDYTDAKCHNGTNGTMTAKVIGGVRSYTYNVTSTSGAEINKLITDADNYNYSSFAADEYTFKVTDANSCVISKPFTIGQPDPLTVSVSTLKDVVCKGTETGEVSATAKGGTSPYSYSWNKGMTGQSIQNLPAGEYSVLVTDANNCQSEVDENGVKAQTAIDEPASALTMLEPVYANPTCSYNEDGIITINVSGGWGGYKYALNGVSYGSNSIEGLNEGTYTAKVTDAKGCEVSTNDITLKKPEALSFENKIGTIICKGGATDVTITSASGGTGCNYSYSIDGGNTWQTGTTFANVVSGSYILRMKDGNECLATDKEITVTEPESLVLKEDVRHNYNGSTHKANGKITVTPQGGVMPYSYQWKDTTVTSQVLDNIGFGLYTIIVTDKLGCVETNTYYINDNNPTPEVVDAICPEGADGSIRFGETVECTRVEWYNARTEEQLMQSDTKTITGLPKGIYKAKLFNDSQVTYIYAEVKAPDSLEYVQNQTDIDCHGDDSGKASVSITGGVAPVSVIWKNQKGEEISRNQTIENLITGKYTAYISDAQNCQSSSKTLVFDITEPADAFVLDENTHNNVKCYGNNDGVVVLRASGNQGDVTYFQNGAAIPSNEAKSLYAGDYAFYAVDAKNCKTQTMNVVVSQPEPLSSSVKTIMPIKCAAETGSVKVEAEGGTTPYSYKVLEQNDFRLSPIFDGLTTDDYKFVVKDVNNCYDTASYLLTEPEQLVITGNQLKDEYCGHSDGTISIEIAGGTGGYDTRWSDYQTGESASDLAAGSYQVSVFDENGCLATETYEIKNIPAPVVSIRNIDSTKCYGSADGVAQLNVSLGTGAITYQWATDTTDVPYSGKLKAGLQSVVAVDELGCADTTQFTMPQPDSMKIVIAIQNPLCFNDNSGKLTASVSNFKSGLSYIWDNGVDGNENADLYAGTYGVSVTNANGCIAKKNATLVYPAKITIKKVAIDDTKCDQPNGSITVTATGGTGVLQYGVNQVAVAAANKIEGLPSGNHKLTVVDENQCSIDSTIFVGANVPPVLVINTRDDVKCHGYANGKVSVGVEGGRMPFVYSWDNGDRTTMSTKNGLGVGSHKAYVYDGFGCSDTLDFAIDEPYVLEIYESSSSDPVCYGYSNGQIVAGVMGGTAPYTYQWGDKQNTAKATGLAAGSHYLNVTDKNGCKAKKYFTLSNPQPVVVDIPEVISICSNQTADIDAGHEGSFHYWSSANGFESVAQNISVNKKGTYVVTVTTLDGCIGSDSTFVNVSDKEINSNFLLQSDAYVGDTIVMIEISWPLPESIEWSCPEGMTIISDAGDEIEIVADKEGVYDIGLTTYNDICTEQTFKSIVVNPRAQKPKQMLQAAPKIIKSVNVYPSPTTGPFNLEIELSEEHDVSIEVVHISGKLQTVRHMKGDRNYVLNFSNAELNAGIHTISVSAGAEKVTKKVVIVK